MSSTASRRALMYRAGFTSLKVSESDLAEVLEWRRTGGTEIAYRRTSGHAPPADLRTFAAIRPKLTAPVHGVKWDEESHGFGAIRRLADADRKVLTHMFRASAQ